MSTKQALAQLLENLPEDRLTEVLDFARFVLARDERKQFQQAGREQFARAYAVDEPEYTQADVKQEPE